jgi:ribosomal protein L11 methyltransferase
MNRRNPLWKISVATTPEGEEAVAEKLSTLFSQPASSYTDAETGTVLVSVYVPRPPKPFREALATGLARIKQCGIDSGSGRVSLGKIRAQDWANSWKRHFKPIEVGPHLLIRPSWSKRRARSNQAVIVLDPGLSFGTGQHPTTGFCLEQLAVRSKKDGSQSFLDMGTGSGILAIAAAKLGYSPIDAFDFDPESIRVAGANARRNHALQRITFQRSDLTKLPRQGARKYDLICANLISDLLISERARIVNRLKPLGVLILAGVLKAEFEQVEKAYGHLGLTLIASRADKEWRSGAFCQRRI